METYPITNVANPDAPLTEQEKQQLTPPNEMWTDEYALKIVKADFQEASSYRNQNHDRRFDTADRLYQGFIQRKTWEGTTIPRSAVPVMMTLEQIESLLPNVLLELFGDPKFFGATPMPGSTMEEARDVENLLMYQFDGCDPSGLLEFSEVARRALKDSFLYGIAPVHIGWKSETVTRKRFRRVAVPVKVPVPHPLDPNIAVMAPNGEVQEQVIIEDVQETVNRPVITNISPRDFYIDPHTPNPNPQEARYIVTRHMKTLAELQKMGNLKLPSPQQLVDMAKQQFSTIGDQGKRNEEAYRNNNYNPTTQYTSDPNQLRVEVLCYQQKYREVYVLNRSWVAYNAPNSVGMFTYANAFYVDMPNRFYGVSISDLVEGDQRLAEAIINARIDELSLLIHAPIAIKSGTGKPASQFRLYPGKVLEFPENVQESFQRIEMGNVTANAYVEVDALERRVQKYTGVTDLVLGTPAAGGNSALRTATGVNQTSARTGNRIQYVVKNDEINFINPILVIVLKMNQLYLDHETLLSITGADGTPLDIDPINIKNARMKFTLKAAERMRARFFLTNGGIQNILATYLNPTVMQQMAMMGKAPNFDEIDALICQGYNIPPKTFWRNLSPQEQQQLNQPSPDQQLRAQMQQDRIQGQMENADERDETKLLQTIATKLLAPPEVVHAITGVEPPKEEKKESKKK